MSAFGERHPKFQGDSTCPYFRDTLSVVDALFDYWQGGEIVMDFLKKLGKQGIAVIVVGVIVFFVWPGATLLFFIGLAAGVVLGNLYDPLESAVEKFLSRM